MNDVVFVVVAVVLATSTVMGLWRVIGELESAWTKPRGPGAELLALRMELHEAAHATRVEMVRVAREAAQQGRT